MSKVGFHVNLAALLVGCQVGSVLKVDISGLANEKRSTEGFLLKVMLGGSLCVLVPCILQLSCGTISNLD